MSLKSIVTFTLLVLSVVFASDNTTQEVIPVPPREYREAPLNINIIGGSNAGNHQFPWQASINLCAEGGCTLCGGSLISSRHILTAAHCTKGKTSFEIGLGSNQRNGPATRVISRVKIEHPDYDPQTLINDVSIIKLPYRVPLNNYVQTIALANSSIGNLENQTVTVSGYGQILCEFFDTFRID